MYEFRRGTGISNTVKNICDVFGDNAVSIPTCERWFAKFKRGDFNLEHQPHFGRPSDVDDDIMCNKMDINPWISTQTVSEKLKIDRSTTSRHLVNSSTTKPTKTFALTQYIMNNNRVNVHVSEGKLIGIIKENIYGDKYTAFRGIPYAKPPIGELRFKVNVQHFVAFL